MSYYLNDYRRDYLETNGHLYIKDSVHTSEMREQMSEFRALKANHSSEITKLKSEMKVNEQKWEFAMKVNEQKWENFAEKLYGEKEFSDVKIICDDKHFDCHKVVLGSQSEVLKTMFKNKSLIEKQSEGVMKIDEKDVNSDTMEQFVHYLYFQKVKDNKMINADLMIAADKYNVKELLDYCTKYLESNLSDENALDVLVKGQEISNGDIGIFNFPKKNIENIFLISALACKTWSNRKNKCTIILNSP